MHPDLKIRIRLLINENAIAVSISFFLQNSPARFSQTRKREESAFPIFANMNGYPHLAQEISEIPFAPATRTDYLLLAQASINLAKKPIWVL